MGQWRNSQASTPSCRIHIQQNTKFSGRTFLPGLYTIEFTANPCIAFCSYMNAVSFS